MAVMAAAVMAAAVMAAVVVGAGVAVAAITTRMTLVVAVPGAAGVRCGAPDCRAPRSSSAGPR